MMNRLGVMAMVLGDFYGWELVSGMLWMDALFEFSDMEFLGWEDEIYRHCRRNILGSCFAAFPLRW